MRPGFARVRSCHFFVRELCSFTGKGLGPTMDMSPVNTLISWGSSSKVVLERNNPKGVKRGSFGILKVGNGETFKCLYFFCNL